MKIVLSKQGTKDRGGDIVAISRLLLMLEDCKRKSGLSEDLNNVLDMWIDYLDGIASHLISANWRGTPEKSTFDLPFEKDFSKYHTEKEFEIRGVQK